ncbi:MAG: tellurite resistance methyltransferase TehB [Proteobacteria bacterium]|nr:MAG: tellurite resistance methyltransferase TehB [Pseudomonadota bacterium]PIE40268.1 MAG: tellurite resistance methyltransferase TehB [Gammaproteobacteria bacterium]
MNHLVCYKTLPEWTESTIPKGFRSKHNTQVGTWGKIIILAGKLKYYSLDEAGNVSDTAIFDCHSNIPFVEPQAWHKIEAMDDELRCQLAFYCRPEDYYQKKYRISDTHPEVLEVVRYIQSGKAMDMGCGRGRNALFLQRQGFDVSAFDANREFVNTLQNIIEQEGLEHIRACTGDGNAATLTEQYDLILNIVVMMFLKADRIPDIIRNMQACTRPGGYNVIVCAMDSPDYPLTEDVSFFSFTMKAGELSDYYKGWNIKKYNEDVGHLHRTDAAGNRIALRFATLIAQNPS